MLLMPMEGLKEGIWGINVTGLFIFPRTGRGLGSSTCMDLLGSGYMCGRRFSGSGLRYDTKWLKEEQGIHDFFSKVGKI